ncbi:helix-turn-helix transcriptional regulator [Runella sp.]|uniref:helix-turn-helix transcriptional regulator n=1 Tax=Runella sp. TaxID=1960881 RepID=UPI003D0D9A23
MNTIPALQKSNAVSDASLEIKIHEFYRGMLINPLKKIPPISTIASGMNMTVPKFQAAFKRIYGHAPYQAYMNIRLEYAKQILCTGQFRVWQVSAMLGYSQSAKFVLIFREKTGLTPKQFVQVNKKKLL